MSLRWVPILLVAAGSGRPVAQESRPAESRQDPAAVREQALREGKAAVPKLLDIVANGSLAECLAALDTLATLGSEAESGLPALLGTAEEIAKAKATPEAEQVKTAPNLIQALEKFMVAQGPMVTPESLLAGGEAQVMEPHLIHALSRMGSKALKPMVGDLLGTDRHKRAFAIRTLGAMGREGAGAVAPLRHVLRNAEGSERLHIIDTLGYIGAGARGAVADLAPELDSSDPELRMTAARALWGIGRPAIPALLTTCGSASARGRRAAAWALAAIARTEDQAAWALPRLLQDEDESVRWYAIDGLRCARDLPEPVRASLRDLAARDPSYHVRLSAEVTVLLRERAEAGAGSLRETAR